jgi:hypothetical protein
MTKSSLISRHHNKDGPITRKHGNTLIHTLPRTYDPSFARNCSQRTS